SGSALPSSFVTSSFFFFFCASASPDTRTRLPAAANRTTANQRSFFVMSEPPLRKVMRNLAHSGQRELILTRLLGRADRNVDPTVTAATPRAARCDRRRPRRRGDRRSKRPRHARFCHGPGNSTVPCRRPGPKGAQHRRAP